MESECLGVDNTVEEKRSNLGVWSGCFVCWQHCRSKKDCLGHCSLWETKCFFRVMVTLEEWVELFEGCQHCRDKKELFGVLVTLQGLDRTV